MQYLNERDTFEEFIGNSFRDNQHEEVERKIKLHGSNISQSCISSFVFPAYGSALATNLNPNSWLLCSGWNASR